MIATSALDAGLGAIQRATRIDLCRAAPASVNDLARVSLGHGACTWAKAGPGQIATGPLEVSGTGDGTPYLWVASSATEVLAAGAIENPERVLPGMLVRMPGVRVEIIAS